MVVFTHFDPKTFEECLQYIQDSLDWLADNHDNSQCVHPFVSQDKLLGTVTTLSSLSYSARRSYNDMALVNRFPPEILSRVFLYIRGDFPQVSFSPRFRFPQRSDPSLHQVNLVCRYWQSVLASDPTFWTSIYLSSSAISGSAREFSLKLSRSRSMPLTVYIDQTLDLRHLDQPQGHEILSQAHRIQDLCVYNKDPKLIVSFLKRARELKTIMVAECEPDNDTEGLSFMLTQLEVLSTFKSSIWQKWPMGYLRYLCISSQIWQRNSIESIIELLGTNQRLEELMLANIAITKHQWNRINAVVESRLPLALPRLRRLSVHEQPFRLGSTFESFALFQIVSRLTTPGICARYFDLSGTDTGTPGPYPTIPDVQHSFPAARVCLNYDVIIGTNDVSSWAVKHSWEGHHGFLANYVDSSEVEELWFTFTRSMLRDDLLVDSVLSMQNVTKLVFMDSFTCWSKMVSWCFDRLEELQLHTQYNGDGQQIIGLIHSRKHRRKEIKMLRFVREPIGCGNEAFFPWKKGCWKFARHVGKVVFEERRDDGSNSDYLDFRLPDVCNTASPVYGEWKPWKWL